MAKATTMTRKVKIWLYANGAFEIDGPGRFPASSGALPVFSVDTQEEAERLQVMLCRNSHEGNGTYHLPFSGDIKDMAAVTKMIEETHRRLARGDKGSSLVEPFTAYKQATGVL